MLAFPSKLLPGTLERRYKRFLADIRLADGSVVVAHCPNTGSMATCAEPGATVYLSKSESKTRKIPYTWELTETAAGFIGVNTSRPNLIVANAFDSGLIKELSSYALIESEAVYVKGTRFDFRLSGNESEGPATCYVEVKNVTLFADGVVRFPDAVTERGVKHLEMLSQAVKEGHRGVMLYLVGRPEGAHFESAVDIDPRYADTLKKARDIGVELLAYRANHSLNGSVLGGAVPIQI